MDKGILYLVPTPVGNLGDMTYRGVVTLKKVDLIACEDTRTSAILLKHYGIETRKVSYHKFNESRRSPELVALLEAGKNVAVITDAGTPGISDPAAVLVKAALDQGITVSCLPGATALVPALAASGLETGGFTFAGFLPSRKKERIALLQWLEGLPHTLIFYASTHKLVGTLYELLSFLGDRRCVIAKELSKLHESFFRGTLSNILNSEGFDPRGEFVVLVAGRKPDERPDADFIPLLKEYLDSGLTLRSAATDIAKITGVNRKRIYELGLELKKKC